VIVCSIRSKYKLIFTIGWFRFWCNSKNYLLIFFLHSQLQKPRHATLRSLFVTCILSRYQFVDKGCLGTLRCLGEGLTDNILARYIQCITKFCLKFVITIIIGRHKSASYHAGLGLLVIYRKITSRWGWPVTKSDLYYNFYVLVSNAFIFCEQIIAKHSPIISAVSGQITIFIHRTVINSEF